MSPAALHPTLGPSPEPLPICCSCGSTEETSVLVQLHSSLFLCGCCATSAYFDAMSEGLRLACMAGLTFEPTAFLRSAPA